MNVELTKESEVLAAALQTEGKLYAAAIAVIAEYLKVIDGNNSLQDKYGVATESRCRDAAAALLAKLASNDPPLLLCTAEHDLPARSVPGERRRE